MKHRMHTGRGGEETTDQCFCFRTFCCIYEIMHREKQLCSLSDDYNTVFNQEDSILVNITCSKNNQKRHTASSLYLNY